MLPSSLIPLESGNDFPSQPRDSRDVQRAVAVAATLLAAPVASHWSTVSHMADRWTNDRQYSHGVIVPLFALVVLWSRRDMLKRISRHPSWFGLGLMTLGVVMRLVAAYVVIEPLDALSLLPT